MSVMVADCPRCGAERMTFDVGQALPTRVKYNWQQWCELFCICRNCGRSTIFVVSQGDTNYANLFAEPKELVEINASLNKFATVEGHISIKEEVRYAPPEHVPEDLQAVFNEGAVCLTVECWNAAGAMFRTCVDLATRPLLTEERVEGLNSKVKRDLGLRLKWLFDNSILPESLRDLSNCIREDGNDAVHEGSLSKDDVEDLLDFTRILLERLYSEPARLAIAEERRGKRRSAKGS